MRGRMVQEVQKICSIIESLSEGSVGLAISLVLTNKLHDSKKFRAVFDLQANKRIEELEDGLQEDYEEGMHLCQLMYITKYRDLEKQKESDRLLDRVTRDQAIIDAYHKFQADFCEEYFEYLKTV